MNATLFSTAHTTLAALCVCLPLTIASASPAQAQTRFDFSYRVSDSRINVFDDGQVTRLQLPEGLQLPAVIARTPAGEQILTPRRDGVYLVLDGVHAQIALVWANNRNVQIQYTGTMTDARQGRAAAHPAMPAAVVAAAAPAPVSVTPVSPAVVAQRLASEVRIASDSTAPALQDHNLTPTASPAASAPGASRAVLAVDTAKVDAAAPAAPSAPAITFAVRERETVREALTRWSKDAGWTHLPEHYTVDFDVQILGTVPPYTDFRTGVRALLATTSMTQKPLQPCFYSNQVLRVILRTQRCDQI